MKRCIPILMLILALACQKEPESKIQSNISPQTAEALSEQLDLNQAVVQTPPRVVSSTANLDIRFSSAVAPAHLEGVVLDENPFTFDPSIKGTARWVSRTLLRFEPSEPLKPGQQYKGEIKGKVLLGKQKNVNDFFFSFKSAEQEVLSFEYEFAPIGEPGNVRIIALMSFAQGIEKMRLEKDLSLKGPHGRLSFTISDEDGSQKVRLISQAIERQNRGQGFTISLPKSYTANESKWEHSLLLSAAHDFKVITHSDMTPPDSPALRYGFRFSDAVAGDQDLSAFVSVEPAVDYKIRHQGKFLFLEGAFLPGQSYTARISSGLPSALGDKSTSPFEATFSFNNLPPQIEWLTEGVYMPRANKQKLQFKSVNVRRARLTVTEIWPQNLGFFIQDNVLQDRTQRDRSQYSAFEYDNLHRVGEVQLDSMLVLTDTPNQWISTELDLSALLSGHQASLFVVSLNFGMDDLCGRPVRQRNNLEAGDLYFAQEGYYASPAQYGYYYANGHRNKLLIASDIGITMKEAGSSTHIYCTQIATAEPVSGLSLTLFNRQNRALETVTTNSDGMARFTTNGYYIYGYNPQRGLALLKCSHTPWSTTQFDVAGARTSPDGNNAFIYLDRGVHRPGDTIHLAAICRSGSAPPPERQPVKLTVRNARGQVVLETQQTAGRHGHVYFPISTQVQDATGQWQATLSFGGSSFHKELRVETVKPNRLKITLDVPQTLSGPQARLEGTLSAKYLFGTPAADLTADISGQLSNRPFRASAFPEFQFNSPLKQYQGRYKSILETTLNEQGQAGISFSIPDLDKVPGILNIELNTMVFEKGGNYTSHVKSVQVYPYSAYVGLKNVFEWGWTRTETNIALPIVAVDEHGQPVAGHKLKVRLYVNRDHWWYDYDEQNRRDFRRMATTQLVSETDYVSGQEPLLHRFTADDRGRHYIEIVDETSGHECGLFFYASPWGDESRQDEQRQNELAISADRNVYQPGDAATLSFDSPESGIALFTLEQGETILQQRWVTLSAPVTHIKVNIDKHMLPNCYAAVSLIQPHNQNSNDMPMRLYGIKALSVEDRSTRLPLDMTAPESLRPKENFTVTLKNAGPHEASVTLAVVDEGLLDLTAFQTPSPWQHYFQKVGLGITTRDNYDEIMGLLMPDMDRYVTIGGGIMDEAMAKRVEDNQTRRFVPAVIYQAPFVIKGGQTREVTLTMPNYVGSVRIMAVAASGHSYASREQAVPVKMPLMVLPTIPRAARPGDVFDLPVSVFAMDSTVQRARIDLALSTNLQATDGTVQDLTFDTPGEKDTRFHVQVGQAVGTDTLTVTGRSGQITIDHTVHLPVLPANPFYTDVTEKTVSQGETVTFTPDDWGLKGSNKAWLVFTRLPDLQISKRVSDLLRYPYGCLEQTTSSALPQLFLQDLTQLSAGEKQAVTTNVNAAIERLAKYKINGGFSYWPIDRWYQGRVNDWSSSYAGHFLVEARAKGYHVPPALFDHWLHSAQASAKKVNRKNHRYQAYRLFVLALAEHPHQGAMNLLRENHLKELDPLSRMLLAAAYSLSGQQAAGETIAGDGTAQMPSYRELGGTLGSTLRDQAFMAYLAVKMNKTQLAARLIQSLASEFSPGGWYSTQETALAILAMGHYVTGTNTLSGDVEFVLRLPGQSTDQIRLSQYQKVVPLEGQWDREISISNQSPAPLFAAMMVEGIPMESRIETGHNGMVMERHFYNESGQAITIDEIRQSSPFWMVFAVQSQHSQPIENVALSALLPAGWEVINLAVSGESPPDWISAMNPDRYEYRDIRDDRVNWFFDLDARRMQHYAIKINPTFKGRYTLPPVTAEAMYSPDYYARLKGGSVTVK